MKCSYLDGYCTSCPSRHRKPSAPTAPSPAAHRETYCADPRCEELGDHKVGDRGCAWWRPAPAPHETSALVDKDRGNVTAPDRGAEKWCADADCGFLPRHNYGDAVCAYLPPAAETGFVAVVCYEDGCEKATWKNFHENGHQHICVCGTYGPHSMVKQRDEARAALAAARDQYAELADGFQDSLKNYRELVAMKDQALADARAALAEIHEQATRYAEDYPCVKGANSGQHFDNIMRFAKFIAALAAAKTEGK